MFSWTRTLNFKVIGKKNYLTILANIIIAMVIYMKDRSHKALGKERGRILIGKKYNENLYGYFIYVYI